MAKARKGRGKTSPKAGNPKGKSRKKPSKVEEPSPPPPRKVLGATGDLAWVILLTILAWIHRAFFLISNGDRALPFSGFYHGDAETFFRHARAILSGVEYDSGIPFHPPGFPYLLSLVHSVLGAGGEGATVPHFRVRLLLALLSSLAVGLLFALVRPYLGRVVALLAAALCLYHFGLYVVAVAPVSEGVYITLLIGTLLLWTRTLPHPLAAPGSKAASSEVGSSGAGLSWKGSKIGFWGFLCGLLCGILALVRAESLLLAMVLWGIGLLGWILRRRNEVEESSLGSRELIPWVLFLVGLGLALMPWTLRNHRTLSDLNERMEGQLVEPLPTLVPITLYGPLNLALANHAGADGTFSRDLMASEKQSGSLQLTNPEHMEFLLHGDAMAWTFIKEEPGAWARLVLKKWRLLLDAGRLGWTQWDWPGGLNGLRRPVDIFVPYSKAGLWWILPGCLLGLGVCLLRGGSERRWAVFVLLVTGYTLVVTAFFFGYTRQGLLLVPLWMSFLAVGLVEIAQRLGRTRLGRLAPKKRLRWVAVAALVLLLLEGWGATLDRKYRASGTTIAGRSTLNPDLTVYIRPLPSRR